MKKTFAIIALSALSLALVVGFFLWNSGSHRLYTEEPSLPGETASSSTAKTDEDTLILPVRIHMLQSSDPSVQTTLTEGEIRSIFENATGVNENYWKQAHIRFEIKSVVEATPGKTGDYKGGGIPATYSYGDVITDPQYKKTAATIIHGLTPASGLLAEGFNVVVVHDFGDFGGGIYLQNKVAYVPEQSLKGSDAKTMTFAFAHELGHALGLVHYDASDDPYNIMAISDPRTHDPQMKTHLTSEQIAIARKTASTGEPALPSQMQTE